jgi:hypothetical protein
LADSNRSLLDETVHGIREAKNSFSAMLNQASHGTVFFIEAGRAGPVVMVGADALGDVFETLLRSQQMTLSDAIESLPFKGEELAFLNLRGRLPKHELQASSDQVATRTK